MSDRTTFRHSADEKTAWTEAARAEARKLPDWIRLHLNRAAEAVGAEATAAQDGDRAA